MPHPKPACEIRGCISPVTYIIQDRTNKKHNTCEEHFNQVALLYMRADDCLVVEK